MPYFFMSQRHSPGQLRRFAWYHHLAMGSGGRIIETPFGAIEVRLDDYAPAAPSNDFESHALAQTLCYAIDTGDPEITRAVLDLYTERHQWRVPFGFNVDEPGEERAAAMRPELRRFVEEGTRSGAVTLRDRRSFVTAVPQPLAEVHYVPPVQEKESFIGVILVDQDDKPVVNSRVRIKLPDGDEKEGRTNSQGEFEVRGFVLDGMAEITLLDFDEGSYAGYSAATQTANTPEKSEASGKDTKYDLHLRLNIDPNDSHTVDDKFVLTGGANRNAIEYTQIKTTADDIVKGDAYVDLIFTGLLPHKAYWLEIDPGADGDKYFLLENVTWEQLESIARER